MSILKGETKMEHCKDCCCARSWKALEISEYTGRSIPEHIEELLLNIKSAISWINSIESLLAEAGYSNESSTRHQLAIVRSILQSRIAKITV